MTEDRAAASAPGSHHHVGPLLRGGAVRASANVCQAAGCLSMGSDKLLGTLREAVLARGLGDVAVRRVGCLGLCVAGPWWKSRSKDGSSTMSGPMIPENKGGRRQPGW